MLENVDFFKQLKYLYKKTKNMKKVRLTESDLINIVKRVLKEEEGQPTTCTGNYDQPKGSLFVLDGNLYFQYMDEKEAQLSVKYLKMN